MTTEVTLSKILSGEPLPQPPPRPFDEVEVDRFHQNLLDYLRRLTSRFTSDNIVSDENLRIDDLNGHIEYPAAKSYILCIDVKFKCRVLEITHWMRSGSCSLKVYKNSYGASAGTEMTGSGDSSVSTSKGTYTFDLGGSNVFEVGDVITLRLHSLSLGTNADLAFTLKRERLTST